VTTDEWSWALTGGVSSVLAPAAALALRRWPPVERLRMPPGLAAPGFVGAHATITAVLVFGVAPGWWIVLHAALLLAAAVFWVPVLGPRRLPGGPCALYLFLSSPLLDLAALGVIVAGDPGGLAMLIAMLPINAVAVVLTWRWIVAEEREAGPSGGGPGGGVAAPGRARR
jgi:hypothetical protein